MSLLSYSGKRKKKKLENNLVDHESKQSTFRYHERQSTAASANIQGLGPIKSSAPLQTSVPPRVTPRRSY